MDLPGKVFVVTGGGNGIGREVVLALCARGATVVAVDLSEQGLTETVELAGESANLSTVTLSVTDRDAVEALPSQVIDAHGHVDGVINVAGIIQRFVPFSALSYEEMTRVMDVNFWGVANMCKAFLPHLSARPEATLVNVSSMGAFVPVPGQSVYGASKAAVELLTSGLYAELRNTEVTVIGVYPGGVSTGIAENSGATIPGRDTAAAESAASLTSAPDAARQIVEAVEKGRARVRIGRDARLLDRLARLMPQRATELVARRMSSLLDHDGTGGDATHDRTDAA